MTKLKQGKLKTIFTLVFISLVLSLLTYAVSTTLTSPASFFADDDGNLDLRATGAPTAYDGTSSWNITNATLWSNVGGVWQPNATIISPNSEPNGTFLFNFTNHINGSAEGEFLWNVQVYENNASGNETRFAFAGNRSISVNYADPTVTTTSPVDGSYSLNGNTFDGDNITVVCTASPSSNWNITSVALYTDLGGNWVINDTHTLAVSIPGEVIANFTINKLDNASIADGTNILFACQANQVKGTGDTAVTNEKTSSNRTINVEYPPLITLTKPDDNNWSMNLRVNLNWTVQSAFGTGVAPFRTRIWTNDTGEWLPRTGTITANNATGISKDYLFPEKTAIQWGIQAFDGNDANVFNFSVNRTINIDATNPTISIATANDTFQQGNFSVRFTPTEENLNTVLIYMNVTGSNDIVYTNRTAINGVELRFNISAPEGVFTFNFFANDTAARFFNTSDLYVTVDDTPPAITTSVSNVSIDTACSARNITFTTNELANATMLFDTDTDVSDGTLVVDPVKKTDHGLTFEFGFNSEITHTYNLTLTDRAGNVNSSVSNTFFTPARVCNGWSQFAIYDARINLSVIQNQSGADLVYIWDQFIQDWIFVTAGLSANSKVPAGRGTNISMVHLFENTNSTWFRNTTNDGIYRFNISSVNNFIAIPQFYNFGNLTESFMNDSRDFPSTLSDSPGTGFNNSDSTTSTFNISFFAGYNNSIQDYVSHVFNFTFNNATILEPCPERQFTTTCMETAWVASGFNVSWNGTSVYGNWSKIG